MCGACRGRYPPSAVLGSAHGCVTREHSSPVALTGALLLCHLALARSHAMLTYQGHRADWPRGSCPDVSMYVEDHPGTVGVDLDGQLLQPRNRTPDSGLELDRAADQDEPSAARARDLGPGRAGGKNGVDGF